VAVQDALGNTDISSTASIALALGNNPGGSVLGGVAAANAVGGVATFAGLTLDKVGVGYTFSATSSGLPAETSAAFDVTAGAAARLAFVVQPLSALAGAPLAASVQVLDALGNPVPASTASVALAIGNNPGGSTLSGASTVAAVGGVAAFSGLSLNRPGVGYTLVASSSGLTGATSAAFDIAAGAAAQLAFVVQPENAAVGEALAPPVQVAVQDGLGNVVAASTDTVTLVLGDNPGFATLSGTTTAAALGGVATFADLAVDREGSGYMLRASAAGLGEAASTAFDVASGPGKAYAVGCECQAAGGGLGAWWLFGLLALAVLASCRSTTGATSVPSTSSSRRAATVSTTTATGASTTRWMADVSCSPVP
jgi:hypothetical protein